MALNSYKCYFSFYNDKKLLEDSSNTSCWSYIARFTAISNPHPFKVEDIYIYNFEKEETKEFIPLIVKIINRLTPCSLMEIANKTYIKYTLLDTYDKNLILLNFIRNLWWHGGFESYSVNFFKDLQVSKFNDPLAKLLTANKRACALVEKEWIDLGITNRTIFKDHSNCAPSEKLLIKTKDRLYNMTINDTTVFLTQPV